MNQLENRQARYPSNTWMGQTRTDGPGEFMPSKFNCICSVYIPPSFPLYSQHLDNLLQQLPSPYILLGDFNGHNILWGGQNNDSRVNLSKISLQRMTYVL